VQEEPLWILFLTHLLRMEDLQKELDFLLFFANPMIEGRRKLMSGREKNSFKMAEYLQKEDEE